MPTAPSKQVRPTSTHVSLLVSFFHKYFALTLTLSSAVLGIGERVGITPLGGLVACLYAANPDYVKSKYNLPMLREIENLVAEAVEVSVPFMNPITSVPLHSRVVRKTDRHRSGYCAFTHKAGIHAKAILNN